MKGSLGSLVAVLLLVVPALAQTPSEPFWPCWLGPHRNGHVDYFTPPREWPRQLKRVWQTEVGPAYSTPVLVKGCVYQLARRGGSEVLYCIDVEDGGIVWQREFPTPFKVGSGGERHGDWPKSTPCYANGYVVTLSINGILRAVNARTGDVAWTKDYSSEFSPPHPYWGAATSPLAEGGHVFVHVGNDEHGGALVALDVASGREIWRRPGDGPCYSSPVLATFGGVKQVVEWNHKRLVGIEASTGELLWAVPLPHTGPDQNMPTPVVYRGRVFLGAENRGIRCLKPHRVDGKWVVELLWHQKRLACEMATPIVVEGHVFGLSHYDSGRLFCLDAETGDIRWVGPPRTAEYATFLAIPGHVLVLLSTGELQVLRIDSPDYRPVVRYRVAETPTWAAPVLLRDGILIKDHTAITRWAF